MNRQARPARSRDTCRSSAGSGDTSAGGWYADALAGLSVWALLVPQSLAYATIVGVPVQYGLYTAFAALLVYPLFGTSKHLVVGPSATVGAVSAAVVAPLIGTAALGTDEAATYAAALALATAVVYIALGLLRMGWISTFLSKAVHVRLHPRLRDRDRDQPVASLLGVPAVDGSYMQQLWGTIEAIPDTSGATLVVGAASLALLLVMRYGFPKLPRALIVVTLSIVAVERPRPRGPWRRDHRRRPDRPVLDRAPRDRLERHRARLLIGALAVVFVGYSETLAAARSVARKYRYELDTNQELVAQGMANGAAGLVGGFVVDGSLSKTSVADAAGQKSELASLINAVFILATMLFLATLFESLPGATLGAVVIDAMVGLITFAALKRYYRVNRADWLFFMGAGLGILFFGIIAGILIGVTLSLADADRARLAHEHQAPRARPDVGHVPRRLAPRGPGADPGHRRSRESTGRSSSPTPTGSASACTSSYGRRRRRRGVVVDAEAVHLTDTDGADILIQVEEELQSQGTALALARVHPPVLALWERAGVIDAVGEGRSSTPCATLFMRSPTAVTDRGRSTRKEQTNEGRRRDLLRTDPGTAASEEAATACPRRARAEGQELVPAESAAASHAGRAGRSGQGRAQRAATLGARRLGAGAEAPRPVDLLEEQAQTRLPELGPIRYGRMLASPFTFFRGAAYLMAADLADGPRTGLHAQLCGDAHLSNFGIFAAPDRRLVFSINDFDETLPGPFEWDVKRLAASFAVAGSRSRLRAMPIRRSVVTTAVREYREAMARFAEMRNIDVWYTRLDVAGILERFGAAASGKQMKRFQRERRERATRRTACARSRSCAGRSTASYGSSATLRSSRRSRTCCPGAEQEHLEDVVRRMIRTYRRTLPRDRRTLLESYRYVHAARKVVGVGSVGARTWILLLRRPRRRRPAVPPVQGSAGFGARAVPREEPVRPARTARRRGAADDAGGARHHARLGADRRRSTARRRTSTSGSSGTRRARRRSS